MLCLGMAAKAQWSVGVMAGYDHNVYSCDNGFASDYQYGNRGGLEITVPVQYDFKEWLGVRADLQYVQKGHTFQRSGTLEGTYTNTRDHYLQIPLTASFSYGGKKLRGWVNPGVYGGYWLSSRRKSLYGIYNFSSIEYIPYATSPEYAEELADYVIHVDEKVEFDSRRDRRLDAGLTATVGVGYRFCPNWEARVEGACYYSLVSRTKGSEFINYSKRYDTTWVIRAGVVYAFGKSTKK